MGFHKEKPTNILEVGEAQVRLFLVQAPFFSRIDLNDPKKGVVLETAIDPEYSSLVKQKMMGDYDDFIKEMRKINEKLNSEKIKTFINLVDEYKNSKHENRQSELPVP